jgi:hypothetical protein
VPAEEKKDSASSLAFLSPIGEAERHIAMKSNGKNNIFFMVCQFRN